MTRAPADLLIENGRPWSDGAPLRGADAVAITGGRITAVGGRAALEELAGPDTRRIDARGGTITPGFTDAHIHLVAWARSRGRLELQDCATRAAALDRVAGSLRTHPGTGAVVGRGWDANRWSERPDRASLDAITGDRPVLLHSRDYHALWVNGAALVRAGVSRATPDPPGGVIERDAAGEPTGVVREHAVRLFAALMPDEGAASDLERVRAAIAALHAQGITAVHAFEGATEQRILRETTRGGGPWLRVLMHLAHAGLDHAEALGLASGIGDDRFRIGAIKLFADGTLGSQTASLLEPYEGTEQRGLDLIAPGDLRSLVGRAARAGLALAIHAIGDRAVRSALDAFAAAGAALSAPALPSRIEHVQLLAGDDLPRFTALGVAASMQPSHCTSDIDLVHRHWGTRASRSYPWRSLLDRGVLLAFGSDAPVEPPDTAAGLHAAVTRQRADGQPAGGFVAAERVTLDEALAAYTAGPARLAGAWPRLGRLAPGAIADVAVWSEDLHRLPADQLVSAAVAATVLEGEVVFERAPADAAAPALAGGTR